MVKYNIYNKKKKDKRMVNYIFKNKENQNLKNGNNNYNLIDLNISKNYIQKLLNGNIYYLFIDIKELNKSNKKNINRIK